MTFANARISMWKGGGMLYNIDFDTITDEIVYEIFKVKGNESEALNDIYLSFFITNSSIHNQGIGQSLLQSTLQKFTDKKIILCVYTDNEKAIYIYKKYGFVIIDTGYGEGPHPDSPHYVMQRDVQ